MTSISNNEKRQRLKEAPCFGDAQRRLGQGTALNRRAGQILIRYGEDLSFKGETARTEGRSRRFVVILPVTHNKKLTSQACLLRIPQHLENSHPRISSNSPILQLTLLFLPTIVIPRILLRPLSALKPCNAVFRKRLNLGLQGGLMQRQVVYLANPHDRLTGPAGGD